MVTWSGRWNGFGGQVCLAAITMAAVVVGGVQQAEAQPGGGGGGFGRGRGISRVALISLENVQADLKLTDEQKTKVTEINDKLSEERRALRQGGGGGGGDFAARREQTEKLTQAATEKLNGVLDEAQRKRITEIFVQAAGTAALSDAEVAAALSITEDQKKQLTELRDGYMEEVRGQFQGGGGGGGFSDEQRAKMAELQKAWDEKMMAVLTDEQRQSLEKMKGTAIELDLSQLRGFGGGRRGGGGGGGN